MLTKLKIDIVATVVMAVYNSEKLPIGIGCGSFKKKEY
jgi:hypothetical protein